MSSIDFRKELARYLLDLGVDEASAPEGLGLAAVRGRPPLELPFPEGLAPVPQPLEVPPAPDAVLPPVDAVAITWTVAEAEALSDVLTPGVDFRDWYPYTNNFEALLPQIKDDAPSRKAGRLASYFPTQVGGQRVLCMKSELHLNRDGIEDPLDPGKATLPVKELFRQIVDQAKPTVVLTVGTAGSVFVEFGLGDVVITRGAKFRCQREFRNQPFAHQAFQSDWEIPQTHLAAAEQLAQAFAPHLVEPKVGPPTVRYNFTGPLLETPPNQPRFRLDGRDMPAFHPILTTDFFEFGTSTNDLQLVGAAVEMGDAVLGLLSSELADPPRWAVVRNMSDPTINGELPTNGETHFNEQTMWAVAYYASYGYWTSAVGALATWGILAGLDGGA